MHLNLYQLAMYRALVSKGQVTVLQADLADNVSRVGGGAESVQTMGCGGEWALAQGRGQRLRVLFGVIQLLGIGYSAKFSVHRQDCRFEQCSAPNTYVLRGRIWTLFQPSEDLDGRGNVAGGPGAEAYWKGSRPSSE